MTQYRQSFMRQVARFAECGNTHAQPTELGLAQFHARESRGIRPEEPDPYFVRLCSGKASWEWTLNEYEAAYWYKPGPYGCPKWWGWWQLEKDFADDLDGLEQVRTRVLRGHSRQKTYG